jgi:hypothetical protein
MIGQRNSHSVVNRATFLILGGLRIFFRLIGHRAANFLQSGSVMPAGGFPALPKIAAPRLDRRAGVWSPAIRVLWDHISMCYTY